MRILGACLIGIITAVCGLGLIKPTGVSFINLGILLYLIHKWKILEILLFIKI